MFPGTENTDIILGRGVSTSSMHDSLGPHPIQHAAFNIPDYANIAYFNPGTKIETTSGTVTARDGWRPQNTNQIITFRNNNPYDNTPYYRFTGDSDPSTSTDTIKIIKTNNELAKCFYYYTGGVSNNYIFTQKGTSFDSFLQSNPGSSEGIPSSTADDLYGMCVYPRMYKTNGLLMSYKEAYSYMLLNPGDQIVIPVMVEYRLNNESTGQYGQNDPINNITKTIAFDIRTSLYKDPMHYEVEITAKYNNTPQDKLVGSLVEKYKSDVIKTKQYNTIVS
jgi:hypothetical protein